MKDDFIKETHGRGELETILRTCVHCGFCNATCPTYQLTGNELDGPRGRIHLLKQALEGQSVSRVTQQHLDRCLTCRSCETTCPSGVRYGRLLDAGRAIVDARVGRTLHEQFTRGLIKMIFPYRRRFGGLLRAARVIKPFLPAALKKKIPARQRAKIWPTTDHARKMLILPGCVQPTLSPSIDSAAARVLDTLGISLIPIHAGGCCGALPYHLSDHHRALLFARKNIDACWPHVEQGAKAIVMTASGCGVMFKDYGELLKHDGLYAEKAARFSALAKDIAEIVAAEDVTVLKAGNRKVAFQSPCTLQHGQQITGLVEILLKNAGYTLTAVADGHLCCGSAGVYSLLQPDWSRQLLENKLRALEAGRPDIIATANIGCLSHLQTATSLKIVHWIELLDNQ